MIPRTVPWAALWSVNLPLSDVRFSGMAVQRHIDAKSGNIVVTVSHRESGSSSQVMVISGTCAEQQEREVIKATVTLANSLADELKVYEKLEGGE
jgi:hypothetical protein